VASNPAGRAPLSWSRVPTFYEELGLTDRAEPEVVRATYNALSRSLHPDRPNGDVERFKRVTEAYEVLSKPTTRNQYDAYLQHLRDEEMRRRHQAEAQRRTTDEEARRAAQQKAKHQRKQEEAQLHAREDEARRRRAAQRPQVRPQLGINRWQPPFNYPWPITHTIERTDWGGAVLRETLEIVVHVLGQRGYHHDGFTIPSPWDGQPITAAPGLEPGDYTAQTLNSTSTLAGPAGRVILRYTWPDPIPGSNVKLTVNVLGKDKWRARSFRAPLSGASLRIPPGAGAKPLRYEGAGSPGEFGGQPGDLIATLMVSGRTRGHLTHFLMTTGRAALKAVAILCAVASGIWVILMIVGYLTT